MAERPGFRGGERPGRASDPRRSGTLASFAAQLDLLADPVAERPGSQADARRSGGPASFADQLDPLADPVAERPGIRIAVAGAGGFGRETADAVRAAYPDSDAFAGFLDDGTPPERLARYVLGAIADIRERAELAGLRLVVCVGNPRDYFARARIVERLALPEHRYATVVHPFAHVSQTSAVGAGSVLLAGAVLTADAVVGRHVAVMPQAVVTHDAVVADYATLASGVRLGGGTRVGEGAYLGAGALVREGVRIGAWAQIGMGAVVLNDVPAGEVWVGSPARKLRDVVRPEHHTPEAVLR